MKQNNFRYREAARLVLLAGIIAFSILNFSAFVKYLGYLIKILAPVIIGLVLAFVLNMPMTWFEEKLMPGKSPLLLKIKRPLAIAFSLLIFIAILALVLLLVIPQSAKAIEKITDQAPALWDRLMNLARENQDKFPAAEDYLKRFMESSGQWTEKIFSNAGPLAGGLLKGVTGIMGGVMNTLLGFGFAIFMLLSKEDLIRQMDQIMKAYLKPQRRMSVTRFLNTVVTTFSSFISGQVKEAIVVGIIATILMVILRFPYATIIGPITGVTSLIPMVGAFLGGLVGFLLIMTVNPVQALLFLLFIVIFQQVDGMLIYPKVVGDSVGLPPLWVFFSVIIGGALFGFVGTFLGVPTMAVIYQLTRENVNSRLELFEEGAYDEVQILKIPKGKSPVWQEEVELGPTQKEE